MANTINIFEIVNKYTESIPADIDGLARALEIRVNYAYLGDQISGMIEREKNGDYLVSINENDPKTRQRFTLAHEIGHFIYHKTKMDGGIDDDRMYRSTDVGKYHNTKIGPKEETQANRFAANFLMSWSAITTLQKSGVNSPEDMADKLKVSRHAMRIRLGVET